MKFFKNEARQFRESLSLTPEQLAKAFHVTAEEIRGYESGKAIPALILKRYQMFKHSEFNTPEDFLEIGDFGPID